MLSLLHMTDSASFSERHGYHGTDVEITTREDAPEEVRAAVLMLGYAAGMGPGGMRDTICEVLLKRPDPNNWSPGNIENEVHRLSNGVQKGPPIGVEEGPPFRII